ncbi:MAG: ComEC/Rec2 family competence protein, partial [Candidatus Brocadiia bacterium]
WVFCASFIFSRRPSSINSLSLAAIILLLIRPTNLFEAGWQLSFASVLGIGLFTDRINFFIHEKIFKGSWLEKSSLTKPYYQIIARQGPFLLNLLCVGFSAWLGGAGILLYHFYTIPPLASLWTVMVFPFVAMILTVGYLKIVLTLLLPSLADLLGVIVTGVCDIFIAVVKFLADLNISEIIIGKVPLIIIACFYLFILLMRLESRQHALLKKIVTTALFVLTAGFLIITKYDRTFHSDLRLTALDVGHGQAVLVQLPSNTNLLFDAGSMYRSDIGRKVVIPFLNHSGIPGIDRIIISHNDTDHINGIPEIVEYRSVRGVYADKAFFAKTDQWGTAKFLMDSMRNKGIPIESIAENPDIDAVVKIDFLWPRENFPDLTDNNKSLVTKIEFAGRKILICSDIEKYAQQKLMELYPDLKAYIVVVPHHGSVSSFEPRFIEFLRPEILIFSCDENQYERHIGLAQNKTPSLFTSNDGAISVNIDQYGSLNITKYK